MRVFSMDVISDIEKRLNIKNIPILVMREYAIEEYYNCEYKEAVKYLDSFKEKHRLGCVSSGWLDENQGGGGYCSSTKCVLLSCSANNRTLAHELGHAKQDRFLGATIENIDADFLEAHNIIVNENLFNEFTYPNSLNKQYLEIYNFHNTNSYDAFYRIIYKYDDKVSNISKFINSYYTIKPNPTLLSIYFTMYQEMIDAIKDLEQKHPYLCGVHMMNDSNDINIIKALTSYLNFILQKLENKQKGNK